MRTLSVYIEINGLPVPHRLHQEDFAQALGIASVNKYEKNQEGYMKMLFDVIRSYSSDPVTDSLKLWDICVFNYLVGNTDNHKWGTKAEYTKLRKFLQKDGYIRIAPEVYMRIVQNRKTSEKHYRRIEEVAPKTGTVRMIRLTEKQYNNIYMVAGEMDY